MEIFGGATVDGATLGDIAGGNVNTTTIGLTPDAAADAIKRLIDNAHHERLRRDADEQERRQRQADLDRQFVHIADTLASITATLSSVAATQQALMRIIWALVLGSGALIVTILVTMITVLLLEVQR